MKHPFFTEEDFEVNRILDDGSGTECPYPHDAADIANAKIAPLLERVASLKQDDEDRQKHYDDTVELLVKVQKRVARLEAALIEVSEGAPKEEPERYDGDNHGDSFYSGYDLCHWSMAETARAALLDTGSVSPSNDEGDGK